MEHGEPVVAPAPDDVEPPLVELDNVTRSYRGRPALGPITLRLEN
jgi:hypothetical protein